MAVNPFKYDHPVTVSTESGETLDPGRFVGESGTYRSGEPRWRGDVHTNTDPLVLFAAGSQRLEFENGAVGYARCTSSSINAWAEHGQLFLVKLRGQGEPTRVDAE